MLNVQLNKEARERQKKERREGKRKKIVGTKENGRNEERERKTGNMGNERYGEMIACRKKHG